MNSLRLVTVARRIERVRLGRGRRDQLHRVVVERVDQDDEALGLVALVEVHHRNVVDDQGVEFVRDPQIVGGAERLLAQIVEGEARHAHRGARHAHARGP